MTDETLLERASRGDEAAFRLLYERHRDAMFRFAYRLLGSVELAEDVTHDCFLSLMKRPGHFDPSRASLCTYLYAATRNLAMKHFRQRGQEITVEELPEEPQEPQASGPLGKLLDEELAALVREAIAGLVPLQREALVLFEYEGLTLAEIAEIVCADVGTVKARLSRARAGLRRSLTPYVQRSSHGGAVEKVLK
jgi:RNA polymerase sigma-70 factor (ECF subfamily)